MPATESLSEHQAVIDDLLGNATDNVELVVSNFMRRVPATLIGSFVLFANHVLNVWQLTFQFDALDEPQTWCTSRFRHCGALCKASGWVHHDDSDKPGPLMPVQPATINAGLQDLYGNLGTSGTATMVFFARFEPWPQLMCPDGVSIEVKSTLNNDCMEGRTHVMRHAGCSAMHHIRCGAGQDVAHLALRTMHSACAPPKLQTIWQIEGIR